MTFVGISLGLVIAGVWSGTCAWIFDRTRAYRKSGRPSVILSCGFAAVVLNVCSVLSLLRGLDELCISRLMAGDVAIWSYLAASGVGFFFIYRAEMRWRREIGLSK